MRIRNCVVVAGIALAFTFAAATPAVAGIAVPKRQGFGPVGPECGSSTAFVCRCPGPVTGTSFGRLGVDLLDAVSDEGRTNALVSPFGVATVLAMLAQGATEPVRRAIHEVLRDDIGAPASGAVTTEGSDGAAAGAEDSPAQAEPAPMAGDGPVDTLHCRLEAVLGAAGSDDAVALTVVNAVFADSRLDLFPSYAAVLRDRYGARAERLDFAAAGTLNRINAWVARVTVGTIPHLVSHLERDDALVLANAMHFLGTWARPFDPARTVPLPFHHRPDATIDVRTMQAGTLPARYRADEDFQAVALPYGGGEFTAVVVLPREGMEPAAALRGLAADPSWLGSSGFRRTSGSLALPRLNLYGGASLLPVLRELGLASSLDGDANAFAGIADPAPTLSRVAHRAILVLDEEGTEAAAATAAVMTTRAAVPEDEGFEMVVDRPFVLAVRHRDTGGLLFTAWVANPSGH